MLEVLIVTLLLNILFLIVRIALCRTVHVTILGVNLISSNVIGICALYQVLQESSGAVDIALVLSLISFITVVSAVEFIKRTKT